MAKEDKIVLIGIKPTFPHTGFGYIHQGNIIKDNEIKIYDIAEFKEKPDLKTAKEFLESGDYLWNSGMFISKPRIMLEAMQKHMPGLYAALMKIKQSDFDKKVLEEEFEKLESISIDYGIMEKSSDLAVLRGEFPWDDIGDWKAMDRIHKKDADGNIIIGDHEGDAKNCIIIANNISIKTQNVENIIIIDTKDCLFICDKERCQEVKDIVEQLEKDPELIKYTEDIQDSFEFHKFEIDCKNVEIKSTGVVAAIGLSNIYIEKDDERIIIRKI